MINLKSINKSDRSNLHSLVSNFNVMKYVGPDKYGKIIKLIDLLTIVFKRKTLIIKIIIS